MKQVQTENSPKVLVIDVGGTNIKLLATGQKESRKIASGPSMTANKMVREVKNCAKDWIFNRVSLGYPGPVINGHPLREPHNLGGGWMKFNFREAFGCPVKVINDAAMQALGSYKGGPHAFSWARNWPWVGNDCGRNSGADGTGASNLSERENLRGLSWAAWLETVGQEKVASPGDKNNRETKDRSRGRLRRSGRRKYQEIKEAAPGTRLGNNQNAFLGGFRMWSD
jgi:hypothetical protein